MCEVISAVAAAERETIQVRWLRQTLEHAAGGPEKYIDQQKLLDLRISHCSNAARLASLPS